MTIAEAILAWRKERKMSQVDLANHIGVCQSTISRWEAGKSEPMYRYIRSMSELIDVDVVCFLVGPPDAA